MSTIYDFRLSIKTNLLENLYKIPITYWSTRLEEACNWNAQLHGRSRTMVVPYGIWYKNRKWCPRSVDAFDTLERPYCLDLFPNKALAEDIEIITDELGELRVEFHEADRFLTGLILFEAPPAVFKRVLGDTLFAFCEEDMQQFCTNFSLDVWDKNGDFSMNSFVETNQKIIQTMKQRLLRNLVSN